jgi:hypothetical protein
VDDTVKKSVQRYNLDVQQYIDDRDLCLRPQVQHIIRMVLGIEGYLFIVFIKSDVQGAQICGDDGSPPFKGRMLPVFPTRHPIPLWPRCSACRPALAGPLLPARSCCRAFRFCRPAFVAPLL